MITFQTLQIMLFLIPGFIAETVFNSLVPRGKRNDFGRIVEALMFSMLIYVTIPAVISSNPISIDLATFTISYHLKPLLFFSAASILYPTLFSYILFNDYILRIARKIGITKKTSRPSVWYDVFAEKKGYVTIDFQNKDRITGYPRYFSDNDERQFLYLTDVHFVKTNKKTKKQSFVPLDEDGILITPDMKIESIIFHKYEEREHRRIILVKWIARRIARLLRLR